MLTFSFLSLAAVTTKIFEKETSSENSMGKVVTAAPSSSVTAEPIRNAQLLHTSPAAALCEQLQILRFSLDGLLGKLISGALASMSLKCKAISRNSYDVKNLVLRKKKKFLSRRTAVSRQISQ